MWVYPMTLEAVITIHGLSKKVLWIYLNYNVISGREQTSQTTFELRRNHSLRNQVLEKYFWDTVPRFH